MDSWHSYPSIFTLGHSAIAALLAGPVYVEEKVDGSQFSFGVSEEVLAGEDERGYQRVVHVRSKGAVMHPDAPEPMFKEGVDTVKRLGSQLHAGWTYRGEYLKNPRHNGLAYDRIPAQHIILFDVNTGHETYLSQEDKRAEAARLGLECVPLLYVGELTDIAAFRAFLDQTSVLGGQLIEGVVVKPVDYNKFGKDKKVLMGKFVSEAFKEVQARAWKQDNPGRADILDALTACYTSQARWQKAVQHLRERGDIEDSPRDIGKLIAAVPQDIEKECRDEISKALFDWAWPKVRRSVVRGLPDWYKNELLKRQFEVESP